MQEKENIKELKKEIAILKKKLSAYEFGLKSSAIADDYLLRQNAILLRFADSIVCCCNKLEKDITESNKNFNKKK